MTIPPPGTNIPMPPPQRGGDELPPVISIEPKGDGVAGVKVVVQLVGPIGDYTQFLELFTVFDNATENDEIFIVIDTPGGDVFTTQLLVERIESCKATVTTVASGLVASAGTMLWFYGHKREVGQWARFMFHSSLHGDWGKSLQIKETATQLVNYMASILSDEQKAGILLAKEVLEIMQNKADVNLSAATIKARDTAKGVKNEEGQPVVPAEGQPAEGQPAEGQPTETQPAEVAPAEATPTEAAPAEAAPAEVAPAPAEGQPAEGTPTEGGDENPFTPENIFKDEGIESPEPVQTPENQPTEGGETSTTAQPPEVVHSTPEAKCGGKKKRWVKRRVRNEDGTESTIEIEEDVPEGGAGEAETAPVKPAGTPVPGEGEPAPTEGNPEKQEVEPGGQPSDTPPTETQPEFNPVDLLLEGEEVIPAEPTPAEPAPAEAAPAPAEGAPAETQPAPAEGEGVVVPPAAKCGRGKKTAKAEEDANQKVVAPNATPSNPSDPGGSPVKVVPPTQTPSNPAEPNGAEVEVVPTAPTARRYW